jgi:hypothetical protein
MCLRMRPVTPSCPAALWLGVRRKIYCMMAKVIQPEIIGIEDYGVGRTSPSHGNGVLEVSAGSRDNAVVSICVILAIASSGAVMRWPVVSCRIVERSVGRVEVSCNRSDVRWIDLSAALGFLINRRNKALPYRNQQILRACRMRSIVALRRHLKKVCNLEGEVSSVISWSSRFRRPSEAMLLGDGERSVRSGSGGLTSCQRVVWEEVSHTVPSGLRAARLAKRRVVFTRRRILSTFCRTDLGQR